MLGGNYWKRTRNEDQNKRGLRVGCWTADRRIGMGDGALGMLMHMRKQVVGNPVPYVEVRAAAISVSVDPGGSKCRALVEELLRDGYIRRYPSLSLEQDGSRFIHPSAWKAHSRKSRTVGHRRMRRGSFGSTITLRVLVSEPRSPQR